VPNRLNIDAAARWLVLVLVVVAVGWSTQLRGLVSSNDGSHVALARALARGEVQLGPDAALTLWVDHARVDGVDYSDRPPGTALLAVPAVLLGRWLDARWLADSLAALRSAPAGTPVHEVLVVRPATDRYIGTYGVRRSRTPGQHTDLLALQGTAAAVGAHAIALGSLGLIAAWFVMARAGLGLGARVFASAALAGGSLWGPYATTLFAHVTAGAAVALAAWAWIHAGALEDPRRQRIAVVAGGFAAGWACITDYTLVVVVVPMAALHVRRGAWPWVLVGLAPPLLVAALYHQAAFGAWWSIGYDHQTRFAFARERASTFSGDPLQGAWILWGLGRDAGVLAQAPIVLVGTIALLASPLRRWAWPWLPWFVLLAFHRTPWGGAGEDHRYLVPFLPFAAVGVGWLWDFFGRERGIRGRIVGILLLGLLVVSCVLTWQHFWSWRGE